MSVYKENGEYTADVFFKGKRVARMRGFKKKSDAKEWHDIELAKYRHLDPTISDVQWTFDHLLERYQTEHLAKKSPGTRARYTTEIVHRIAPFFRYMKLSQVDINALDAFKAKLESECEPKEVNYCLDLTRSLLNRAIKFRMLKVSPYCLERVDLPKRNDGDYKWWDDKEYIQRFLSVAKQRSAYYPAYFLGLETGMRKGEIVGIYKEDIDLDSGRIHVQRKWDWTDKDFGLPKHGIKRWIDFDPKSELGFELRKQMALHPTSKLVFPSETGNPLSQTTFADKVFKSVQRRAQVPVLSIHSLRHTYASWFMLTMDDIWTLKGILGHADIKTTMRYAHHSKKLRKTPLNLFSVVTPNSPL